MSELIDSIYNVEKISGEVKTIIDGIAKIETAIAGFSTVIKGIGDEVRKTKGTEDLIKLSGQLNDNFIKGQKAAKDWQTQVSELNAKTEQLTGAEKAASIEIAKARLELQAAQKATKEAAIADIEKATALNDMSGSYNSLVLQLKVASREYKNLSDAEKSSAQGKELLKKIQDTQVSLKATDASMGNYQRNVGNYASLLEGMTPKLGGLVGTLLDIAKAAKASRDDLNEMGGDNGIGVMANPRIPKGLATIMTGVKGVGQSAIAMGKAFLANPIGVVIAGLVAIFGLMKSAIDSNGEATEKLSQVMAPFKGLLAAVQKVFVALANIVLDGAIAFGNFANSVMSVIPGLKNVAASSNDLIKIEKERLAIAEENRKEIVNDAKDEAEIAELKAKMVRSDLYSNKERLQFARDADKIYKAMATDDVNRAIRTYNNKVKLMKAEGREYKDLTEDQKNDLKQSEAMMFNIRKEFRESTRKLNSNQSKLTLEIQADEQKAASDSLKAQKDYTEKIIAAKRRLTDSAFSLQKDSEKKSLEMNAENLSRQLYDLQKNGELTKQLKSNLEKASEIEADKIRSEWKVKKMNDDIKADELTLQNMKSAGQNTLSFEKELLQKRMDIEILAGGSSAEIKQKYRYLELDLDAKNAEERATLFEKQLTKDVRVLSDNYAQKEKLLKKDFANGKIMLDGNKMTREQYEEELKQIQLDAAKEVNDATIEALKKQLAIAELLPEKKTELSNKLKDLQIANENAVVDSVIAANDAKIKSDEDAGNKRAEIAQKLADLTLDLFSSISDYQIQQSEEKIAGYEKEQEASDKSFEKQQENLDNAIMSDETRAEKQQELNDEKAASEKILSDKILAEKVRIAKFEKAQAIISAIISTAQGVAAALKFGLPWAIPFVALAAVTGAIQVATIAAQPLPAFEHGGVTGDGLALWGEVRPEVAVTPSGETFLADKPTVSNFQAGTRIYKSVSDYENFMANRNSQSDFKIEYDKMPQNNINLDATGLWSIVSKQGARRTMINRRYRN